MDDAPEFNEPLGEPVTVEALAERFRQRPPIPVCPEEEFELPEDI